MNKEPTQQTKNSGQLLTNSKAALEPAIIVIFGITGDLSQRYLLPALYHLFQDNLLNEKTEIVGVSRRDVTATDILEQAEDFIKGAPSNYSGFQQLEERLTMFKMDLANGDDYDRLRAHLDDIEARHGVCMDRLYYLSIPPGASEPVVENLGEHGLNQSCQHDQATTRLLVEKPFGYDLPSAREFIAEIDKHFKEEQVFRIDHYLAKENAQNILVFRLYNPIFETIWDHEHIAHIEVLASEEIGIEGRVAFYEQTGALRDFVQSHLLQLLAITTMEKPAALTSDAIHAARLKLLESIEPVPPDKVAERTIRGQYEGYRDEVGNPDSAIETYASVTLYIKNDRWDGVPMTIRTGKMLKERKTEIIITFKHDDEGPANTLTFYVQPKEGIGVSLCVKQPGFDNRIDAATMDFNYERTFVGHEYDHPNAYEYVLVDAVRGDRMLFATSAEVLASWRILQPILEA